MAKLIYIESSPRKERSASIAVAKAFLEAYKAKNPKDEIHTIDLWKRELPPFDGQTINSKYAIMHGQNKSEEQVKAWRPVEQLIEEFKSGDKFLFSLPMWNFTIPYKLKHYFDLIVQPGYTFKVTEKGYEGLVTGKKAVLIYARGGEYGSAPDLDFQTRYMKLILKFIGFTDFKEVLVDPTLSGEGKKEEVINRASHEAEELAKAF